MAVAVTVDVAVIIVVAVIVELQSGAGPVDAGGGGLPETVVVVSVELQSRHKGGGALERYVGTDELSELTPVVESVELQSGLGVDTGGGGLEAGTFQAGVVELEEPDSVGVAEEPDPPHGITIISVTVRTVVFTTVTTATTVTVSVAPELPVGDVELPGAADSQSLTLLADVDAGAL